MKPQLRRDIAYLATFAPGTLFLADQAFRPNRVAELVKAGALIPVAGTPGHYVTARPSTTD